MGFMTATLPYFSAAQVHAALDFPALIDALARAFESGASIPVRHAHEVAPAEGAKLLLMPAWREGDALAVKVVTVFPGNRARGAATVAATVLLLDGQTGHPRALLDGEALTLRRTGAASALASRHLSRPDSRTLLLVGAGHLAPYIARAHARVRPITRVLVWARREAPAAALAEQLREEGLEAQAVSNLPKAAGQADIISCATTSSEPIIKSAWVQPGTHVDLVGGFTPHMREADDDLIARARLFVDTFSGALAEAGDLVQPMALARIDRSRVLAELADLVSGRHSGRQHRDEVTLFKSVGTALEDLAAAMLVGERLGLRKQASADRAVGLSVTKE